MNLLTETKSQMLDGLNIQILEELSADPRLRTTELARRLGVSTPTVRERVTRLEESGVIRGYRLEIDPAALGRPVAAWVRLQPGPGQVSRIAELAQNTPEVVECHRISGEDCFLLRLQIPAIDRLEELLDRFGPYGRTNSSFVVSTPVAPRAVPFT